MAATRPTVTFTAERKRSQDVHFHRSQLRSQLLVQLWFYRSLFFSRLLLPQVRTCNPWDLEPSCHLHHKARCKSQHTQSARGSCYQDTSVQHKLCLNSCYLLSFSFLLLSCHMSYSSHACSYNQRAGVHHVQPRTNAPAPSLPRQVCGSAF